MCALTPECELRSLKPIWHWPWGEAGDGQMCPDWKFSLQRVLSYLIHLSFRCEEQDPTPRTQVPFSVVCVSPSKWLLVLLSPLSASQHIVRRKHADKCPSISWAHNSVSWGTVNLIHSKAWVPSVILSLTHLLNEILNAFLQHWIKHLNCSSLCNHLAAGVFFV